MICILCENEFSINHSGHGGQNRIFCYECVPTTSDKVERNKARLRALYNYSDKTKKEKGCEICGYNKCTLALEWHHKTDDKKDNPSNLIKSNFKKYLEEVEKCMLLCSNCHRELHANLET